MEENGTHPKARLDTFYARDYCLTRGELSFIHDLADVNCPGYPSETVRVVKKKEIHQHGECCTHRLVLKDLGSRGRGWRLRRVGAVTYAE